MGVYLTLLRLRDITDEIKKSRGFYEHKGRPGKIGGSLPKNSPHFRSFKDKFRYAVGNLVMMHGSAQIEHAHILDMNCRVIHASKGMKGQVGIPKRLLLEKCHVVHTHPTEKHPILTPNDIIAAIESNVKSMTATGIDGNYMRIIRPKGGWVNHQTSIIKGLYKHLINEHKKSLEESEEHAKYLRKIYSGEMLSEELVDIYTTRIVLKLLKILGIKVINYAK